MHVVKTTMRAFVLEQYGEYVENWSQSISIPEIKSNEILVRVKMAAVNDYDWALASGRPWIYRLMFGLTKPRNPIPGMELSGIVEKIGSEVKEFQMGDAVYGDISDFGFGGFGELVALDSKAVRKKPESMSFAEACALPHAGLLALQSIDMAGDLSRIKKVLINGAGGGVGNNLIQLLKNYELEITGVDSADKMRHMLTWGYDKVLDYKMVDFTELNDRYDLIIDAKTNRPARKYATVLTENGKYITVGGSVGSLLRIFFRQLMVNPFSKKKFKILALKPNQGLERLEEYFEQGQLVPHLDGPHSYDDLPRLIRYFGEGRHVGKVVVEIS